VCQLLVLGTSNYVVAAALASRAECHVPQNVDFTANHWSGQMLWTFWLVVRFAA